MNSWIHDVLCNMSIVDCWSLLNLVYLCFEVQASHEWPAGHLQEMTARVRTVGKLVLKALASSSSSYDVLQLLLIICHSWYCAQQDRSNTTRACSSRHEADHPTWWRVCRNVGRRVSQCLGKLWWLIIAGYLPVLQCDDTPSQLRKLQTIGKQTFWWVCLLVHRVWESIAEEKRNKSCNGCCGITFSKDHLLISRWSTSPQHHRLLESIFGRYVHCRGGTQVATHQPLSSVFGRQPHDNGGLRSTICCTARLYQEVLNINGLKQMSNSNTLPGRCLQCAPQQKLMYHSRLRSDRTSGLQITQTQQAHC